MLYIKKHRANAVKASVERTFVLFDWGYCIDIVLYLLHVVFADRPSRRRQDVGRVVVWLDLQFDDVRKGRAPHSGLCTARCHNLSIFVRRRDAVRQSSVARGHASLLPGPATAWTVSTLRSVVKVRGARGGGESHPTSLVSPPAATFSSSTLSQLTVQSNRYSTPECTVLMDKIKNTLSPGPLWPPVARSSYITNQTHTEAKPQKADDGLWK